MTSNVTHKKPMDSSLAKTAISLGGTGFLSPQLAFGFETHLSEIISKSGKLLCAVIQNKIAAVKPANMKNENWIGKKINRMFRVDSEHIELSGTELVAVMELLREYVDMDICPKGTYLIPIGEAERILSRLNHIRKVC